MDVDSTIAYLEYLDYIDLQNYCHYNKELNFLCHHILKEILIRKGYRVTDDLPYLLQEFYKLINTIVFYLHPTIPNYVNNKKRFYDNKVKILRNEIVNQLSEKLANYLLYDSLNLTLDINIMKTALPNKYNENRMDISVDMLEEYIIPNLNIDLGLIDDYKKDLIGVVVSMEDFDKYKNCRSIYNKMIHDIKLILNDLLFIKY